MVFNLRWDPSTQQIGYTDSVTEQLVQLPIQQPGRGYSRIGAALAGGDMPPADPGQPALSPQPKGTGPEQLLIPEVYREFADVFSKENTASLPAHAPSNHQIELLEREQPP